MRTHRDIQQRLYDYHSGQIDAGTKIAIDKHVAGCTECAGFLASLDATATVLVRRRNPADQRSEEFWNTFALQVEQRIRETEPDRAGVFGIIGQIIGRHRRLAVSLGTVAATISIVVSLWRPWELLRPAPAATFSAAEYDPSRPPDRVSQYFRRSKVLLVGLSNLGDAEGDDLSLERRVSRELVHEARSLPKEGLDSNSAVVMNDLEKILVSLANTGDEEGQAEFIRNGIQRENLLFRLRMAEAMRDSTMPEQAAQSNED